MKVILLFLFVGVCLTPVGIAIIVASGDVTIVDSDDYSGSCCVSGCDSKEQDSVNQRVDQNPCNVTLRVTKTLKPPIFMYYVLNNFYQNHRVYVKSRSDAQLAGYLVDGSDLNTQCTNYISANKSISDENTNNTISPCGLTAWSVFNDSFALLHENGTEVAGVSEDGIAWSNDVNIKYHNALPGPVKTGQNFPPFYHEFTQDCEPWRKQPTLYKTCVETDAGHCFRGSGKCMEDQHFMVWMRLAGLSTFRKLYARIDQPIAPGNYQVRVSNGKLVDGSYYNYYYGIDQKFLYPVHTFGGTKKVVLTTSEWAGGQNYFMGVAYLVVGIICLVLATCFAVKHNFFPEVFSGIN
jgi:hypothetical protein